ncbi:Predicted nucleotidyltransferase [Streptomyces sp. WMMB 714]|uniref:nucleotidyltransferase domain-containing protein n=1 Tax=Streptomyces sp. WMMB 714 TaxID=1286822 RepID=UPI0005F80F88|nr:nucleotidyltransferase domain-containing protein [Streptomyces sp. WMMB 714]SCK19998.1 Predicted nucleotidyltransferase [Streptomyces sp. WMMB 714]
MTPEDEFGELRARLEREDGVLGAVLSGSRAREGMATELSDYDVLVVVEDAAEEAYAPLRRRDARLDVTVMPLREFRTHALPGSGTEWNRYAFVHAELLKDSRDGLVGRLLRRKGRLTEEEAAESAPVLLDAFLNSLYRCLKNDRDGDALAARLDAAESVPFYLGYVFALEGRVRPYNKYLGWELRRHPLDWPQGRHDHLLGLLGGMLSGEVACSARQLFVELEPRARAAGHEPVLASWGEDLTLMRGGPSRPGRGRAGLP